MDPRILKVVRKIWIKPDRIIAPDKRGIQIKIKMPRPFLLVSQSDYLIQTVDIKSHAE